MNRHQLLATLIPLSISSLASAVLWTSLPFRLHSLHLSLGYLGILQSASMFGILLIELPASILIDIHGRRRVIIYGVVTVALALAFMSITISLAELVVEIILFAMGYNLISLPIVLSLYEETGTESRGKASSLNLFATSSGAFTGLILAGFLNLTFIPILYAVLSGIIIASGLVVRISPVNKRSNGQHRPALARYKSAIDQFWLDITHLPKIIRKNNFLKRYVVIQGLLSFCWGSTLVFLPALSLRFGLNLSQAFILFSGIELSSMAFPLLGGYIADKLPTSFFFIMRPLSVLVPFLALVLANSLVTLIIALILVETWSLFAPGNRVFVFDQYSEEERSVARGVSMLITHIIGIVSPLVGLLLWEISPKILFGVSSLISIPVFLLSINTLRVNSKSKAAKEIGAQ